MSDKPRKSGDMSDMVHRIKQVEPPPVKVSFALTKAELWELICNFDASFVEGAEGNELAERVAAKLHQAYEQFR